MVMKLWRWLATRRWPVRQVFRFARSLREQMCVRPFWKIRFTQFVWRCEHQSFAVTVVDDRGTQGGAELSRGRKGSLSCLSRFHYYTSSSSLRSIFSIKGRSLENMVEVGDPPLKTICNVS
ncbi:unnamed protein product [Arabis nemorensis]|uniref:Uncharacterized protein n=1 Tax=Arabis nemorensis TaxID=586526 RepID=A0A565BJB9_9BRAS|nr:unnamed protein product [Arabis nemorensis]